MLLEIAEQSGHHSEVVRNKPSYCHSNSIAAAALERYHQSCLLASKANGIYRFWLQISTTTGQALPQPAEASSRSICQALASW